MHPSEGKASLRARFSMVVQKCVEASGDPFGIPHGINAPTAGSVGDPLGIPAGSVRKTRGLIFIIVFQ